MNKGLKIAAFIAITFVALVGMRACGLVSWWAGSAIEVAKEEFSPRAMLDKYEWFKTTAAQLDKKVADIEVYKVREKNMRADYEGVSRKDWDRTDKNQFNLWSQEVAGVTASFNGLAAQYNAQMAKFNWAAFERLGSAPAGARESLPREYKPYQYE